MRLLGCWYGSFLTVAEADTHSKLFWHSGLTGPDDVTGKVGLFTSLI
jgi:hypothetical protein